MSESYTIKQDLPPRENQVSWNPYFQTLMEMMMMTIMMRILCELKRPRSEASQEIALKAETQPIQEPPVPTALTPAQREWSDKAVKRYAKAQEKKWRKWDEAMFNNNIE